MKTLFILSLLANFHFLNAAEADPAVPEETGSFDLGSILVNPYAEDSKPMSVARILTSGLSDGSRKDSSLVKLIQFNLVKLFQKNRLTDQYIARLVKLVSFKQINPESKKKYDEYKTIYEQARDTYLKEQNTTPTESEQSLQNSNSSYFDNAAEQATALRGTLSMSENSQGNSESKIAMEKARRQMKKYATLSSVTLLELYKDITKYIFNDRYYYQDIGSIKDDYEFKDLKLIVSDGK